MKTLLLTLATAVLATLFSSCCISGNCNRSNAPLEVKHYDYQGRLVKDIHHDGNYTTYHYDGTTPDYVAPVEPKSVAPKPGRSYAPQSYAPQPKAIKDGSWKPRIP